MKKKKFSYRTTQKNITSVPVQISTHPNLHCRYTSLALYYKNATILGDRYLNINVIITQYKFNKNRFLLKTNIVVIFNEFYLTFLVMINKSV